MLARRRRHELLCTVLCSQTNEPINAPKVALATLESLRKLEITKENLMKSKKLFALVFGALVVLALSLPVIAQDATQSTTTTTTQSPAQPQTQTTQTNESTTKYKHHHKKVKKEKETTTTTTTAPEREHSETTTTTTTPPPQ